MFLKIAADITMIYACDNCHFLFSRARHPEQCPNCRKYAVHDATEAERLKEPREI